MTKSRKYSAPSMVLLYLLLWILLFEIILPVNNVLPKPSIVIQSFGDLFRKYQLGWNYLSTISAIYFPLLLAYYLVKLIFPIILQKNVFADIILSVEWFSRYIPGIILAMILIYWFPKSDVTKFIFAFFISFSAITLRAKYLAESLGSELYHGLQSFGVGITPIRRKVIWRSIQPSLFEHIIKQNIYIWVSVVIFEYVNLGFGIGTILRKILQFKDLSALISLFIIIGISIFLSTQASRLIKNRFYFWKV